MTSLLAARLLHFFGLILWIGTLLSAVRLRGEARRLLLWADIGATLVIATGIYMASSNSLWSQPWLHAKLTLVLGLIALHGYIRSRARKISEGQGNFPDVLFPVVAVAALGILYVAEFRPFAR